MDGFEARVRAQGFRTVAGVDEAGRGPLAGPVVAAAVVLPPGFAHKELRDSKALSPAGRERVFSSVVAEAVSFATALAGPGEIDRLNIHKASLLAMRRAVEGLPERPDFVFVDGLFTIPFGDATDRPPRRARRSRGVLPGTSAALRLPLPAPAIRPEPGAAAAIAQEAVVSGDALCRSIMAASIVAKVVRDRMMEELDRLHPGYGFALHKGYPTRDHLAALRRLGPSPVHRLTFRGVFPD